MANTKNASLIPKDTPLIAKGLSDFSDKESSVDYYIRHWLNRTQSMFKYNGLPDTIPQRNLELILQSCGYAIISEVEGKLYAFFGGLGGMRDVYYQPTIATVANPALNISKTWKIGEECVLIRQDSLLQSMLPMFRRYATMLAENECTIRMADINTRVQFLITAPDDTSKNAAVKFLNDIENGKMGAVADNSFLDGIKVQPAASTSGNALTQLIELEQYLKGSAFMDMGLSSNYNMKREALNSAESTTNDDILLPLIDDMLEQRRIGLEKVNAMYGTKITVELNSAWKYRAEEAKLIIENMESEGDNNENSDRDNADNEPIQEDT